MFLTPLNRKFVTHLVPQSLEKHLAAVNDCLLDVFNLEIVFLRVIQQIEAYAAVFVDPQIIPSTFLWPSQLIFFDKPIG